MTWDRLVTTGKMMRRRPSRNFVYESINEPTAVRTALIEAEIMSVEKLPL